MANMICDVCGTSYPAADDKCPNCGYSRAIAEQAAAEEAAAVVRERVPGGRFSRKNVLKRIKAREAAAEQENTATLADLSLELGEAVAAADFLTETVPEPEPVPAEPQPQPEPPAEPEEAPGDASEIVMDWPILEVVAAEQSEEPEVAPVLFPEMPEAEEDEPAADEPAADEPAEEEAQEEDSDEEVPVILPGEAETEPDAPDQVQPEADKKKKALIVNIALIAAAAIFLLSLLYLAARYGIPFMQNADRPGYSAVETTEPTDMTTEPATDAPTDPPTEAPTDPPTEPPTEPPTDPPTEPPTDPPTEPPTEAPTDPPPLEIPLTLNYYELTFRGRDQGVQMEVEGYRNADITWTSDDPSVATVTENGKIISVGPGTTVVHATYRGHTVSCKIKCMF